MSKATRRSVDSGCSPGSDQTQQGDQSRVWRQAHKNFRVGDRVEANRGGYWREGMIIGVSRDRFGKRLYRVESPDYPGDEIAVWSGDYPASELRRPKP